MKTRFIKSNSYPGDTFRRIDVLTDGGRWIPVIGIYKNKHHKCWENDTNGRTFGSVNKAKEYAIAYYNQKKSEEVEG